MSTIRPHPTRQPLIIAALLMIACSTPATGPASTDIPLDADVPLYLGESRMIAGTGVRLAFESVPVFSLCPSPPNVCTVRERAAVRFTLGSASRDTTVDLQLPGRAPSVDWSGLTVSLVDLRVEPDTATVLRRDLTIFRATVRVHRS